MSWRRDFLQLVPAGLVLDGYEIRDTDLIIRARGTSCDGVCPDCGGRGGGRFTATIRAPCTISRRMGGPSCDHPCDDAPVSMSGKRGCPRQTFAERLADTVEARYAPADAAQRSAGSSDRAGTWWPTRGTV